ncbi:MAG: DUF6069 family protein [Nocardioides sp.]
MTATQLHPSSSHTDTRPRPSVGRALVGGVTGAAAGAVVLLGYGAAAVAIHGPMQAADHGAAQAAPITAASFAVGVLFSGFLGTLLAAAVARWASHPARTFLRAALALTGVSLAFPLTASHTTEATRLILAVGHLIAAAVVIPVVVRALGTPRA